jgi:hypothetical protein
MEARECTVCPVCVVLHALSNAKPEVTMHLAAAARELALAVQALLADTSSPAPAPQGGLERIRID